MLLWLDDDRRLFRYTGIKLKLERKKEMKSPSRILFVLLPLALVSFLPGACSSLPGIVSGSGEIASETRTFAGITGVALATSGNLTIELGEEESLLIEADDNLLPYIKTDIHDGALTIGNRPEMILKPSQEIRYVLTVRSLESIAVLSLGSIIAPALQADHFLVEINSTGKIAIASLNTKSLEVTIVSIGDVEIRGGQVESQQVTIASTGTYTAGDMRSQNAEISIKSSGGATIWVTDHLDVNIKSNGDVYYYGSPDVSLETASSGKVTPLGNK
jgi:hypothetical protein